MGGRCTFEFWEEDEFYATGSSLGSYEENQGTPFLLSLFSVQQFQTTLDLKRVPRKIPLWKQSQLILKRSSYKRTSFSVRARKEIPNFTSLHHPQAKSD